MFWVDGLQITFKLAKPGLMKDFAGTWIIQPLTQKDIQRGPAPELSSHSQQYGVPFNAMHNKSATSSPAGCNHLTKLQFGSLQDGAKASSFLFVCALQCASQCYPPWSLAAFEGSSMHGIQQ